MFFSIGGCQNNGVKPLHGFSIGLPLDKFKA
jgi:hypothetical protein